MVVEKLQVAGPEVHVEAQIIAQSQLSDVGDRFLFELGQGLDSRQLLGGLNRFQVVPPAETALVIAEDRNPMTRDILPLAGRPVASDVVVEAAVERLEVLGPRAEDLVVDRDRARYLACPTG